MIRINLQSVGQKKSRKRAPAPAADAGGGDVGGFGGGVSSSGGGGSSTLMPALFLLLPILGGAGGSFYVHQGLLAAIDDVAARTRSAEAELARLKPILDEIERFKKDKAVLEQKLNALRELESRRVGPVKVFSELGAIMPPQVWVVAVRESSSNAQIDGLGLDSQSIATFVNAMQRSAYFANVELTHVEQTAYLGLNIKRFSVSAQFRILQAPPPAAPAGGPVAVPAAATPPRAR